MKKIILSLALLLLLPSLCFSIEVPQLDTNTTPAASDLLYEIDVSDTTDGATGTGKKGTIGNALASVVSGDCTLDTAGVITCINVNSGIAGRVAYYPSTGTQVNDQGVLFFDGTNIGIGTSTPAYLLDVNGTAYFAGSGGVTVNSGGAFRTSTTTGNTALLQAYNTGSVAYTTFATLTAGSSPTFDLSTSVTISSDTIVSRTGTQTLTNKTLTLPVISTISNSGTITIPTGTDTLVGKATTDTLTNKTLTSPKIGTSILDTNGISLFTYTATASAVNYLNYANGATGTDPTYTVTGDANRGITYVMAGTGGVTITSTNAGPSLIKRGLTVNDDANSASTSDFVVKTSVNAATFHVTAGTGHLNSNGTAPTLSSCGTSPSITGSDNAFRITVGTTAGGCTATFANAWTATPTCTVTNQSVGVVNAMTYTVSTTAVVVTQTNLDSAILNIICIGRD